MCASRLTIQQGHEYNLSLAEEARLVRRAIVDALFQAGGGHYGGSLSVADILLVLYRRHLKICVTHLNHPQRDRLILSKGHAALALYSVMDRVGILRTPMSELRKSNSKLAGHPDMTRLDGIDFSTGSLGQGLSVGVGMALVCPESTIWVILGDGECQEGQVWEAAMLASRLKLTNLVAVVDCNGYQECGQRYSVYENPDPPVSQLDEKWRAFGWRVHECNGNDSVDLEATLDRLRTIPTSPSVLLANTIKGYGSKLVEEDPYRFHCTSVSDQEHSEILGAFA